MASSPDQRTPSRAQRAKGKKVLLWGTFANGPRGGTVSCDFVTAKNKWAIRVCLEAGLAISDAAAVFVRGEIGPLAPYLPSGAYL